MREVAIGWGTEGALLLTEEDSQTTEEGVINALKIIEERGFRPKTILFISAHFLPLRTLLLWQHYAKDVSLLPFGSLIVRDDDLDPYTQCSDTLTKSSFRQNEYAKELAKTAVTFLQVRLR